MPAPVSWSPPRSPRALPNRWHAGYPYSPVRSRRPRSSQRWTWGPPRPKLFPAALGGPSYLRGLRDPLPDVPFVPVGGVDIALAADYLAAGAVAVGVGSPLVGDAARGGDLAALDARATAFLAVTRASHGSP